MKPILLTLIVLIGRSASAQHPYAYLRVEGLDFLLFGPDKENKFGVFDQNGKVLIPPKYTALSDFGREGAVAIIDTTYGFVFPNGHERWLPGLQRLYRLEDGLAPAMKNGKWGFINKKGKTVIPFQFDLVMPFHEGYAPVKLKDEWKFIDKQGRFLLDGQFQISYSNPLYDAKFVMIQKDTLTKVSKKGMMDVKGNIIVPTQYDDIAGFFSNGLCWVKKGNLEGFVNERGDEIFLNECHYPSRNFQGDLIPAVIKGKVGYANVQGQLIIAALYSSGYNFSEGFAAVAMDNKLGFINAENQIVIPLKFENTWQSKFQQGRAVVKDPDSRKLGYIDRAGNWYLPAIYDAASSFENGYAIVKKEGKSGMVNLEGGEFIPCAYEEIWPFVHGRARFAVQK